MTTPRVGMSTDGVCCEVAPESLPYGGGGGLPGLCSRGGEVVRGGGVAVGRGLRMVGDELGETGGGGQDEIQEQKGDLKKMKLLIDFITTHQTAWIWNLVRMETLEK